MKLDEVAERFGLDNVFSYYPDGATVEDLAEVADACTDFFDHDEWLLCEQFQEYAYVSASAIVDLVLEQADSFKRYYSVVEA